MAYPTFFICKNDVFPNAKHKNMASSAIRHAGVALLTLFCCSQTNLRRKNRVSSCPTCQHILGQFDYQGIELARCAECYGLWFKDGQFREVKNVGFSKLSAPEELQEELQAEGPNSPPDEESELSCPDCQAKTLMPYSYAYSSDIQLHRCSKCHGIWADITALLRIEKLLSHYHESLEEAKSKALPLMMKVKNQIQQEEREQEEQKQKKKNVFNRFFGSRGSKSSKDSKNKKVQNIFDSDSDEDDNL